MNPDEAKLVTMALALPTTAMFGICDVNVRKVPIDTINGHTIYGYKSLCRTHWAESPVCGSKRIALADAEKHANREAQILAIKQGN